MDVGNLKTETTESSQGTGKKSTGSNKNTTNQKIPKKIIENNQGTTNIFFAKKPTSNLSNKPTEIGKTKEKYSTMSSVEGIEGNGKNCNQFSTGQVNDGKYSTSGVEESPVKGKGFEPSTGLKDVVAETLEPNSGQLFKNLELTRNNGGWQTSRERPNGSEEKRIDENIPEKRTKLER